MEQFGQLGYNADGELGDGTNEAKYQFVQVKNSEGTGYLTDIKSIAVGYATSYAVTNSGEVYGWGYNNYGQLGSKDATARNKPYKTELTDIKEVSSGEGFVLALANDGTVFATGRNSEGQLGIANSSDTMEWKKMKDTDGVSELTGVKKVDAGRYHTLILKNNGEVYSVGYNNNGQLADGITSAKNVIAPMTNQEGAAITNAKIIAAGAHESAVVTENGELYTCGYNGYSQLANRNVTQQTRLTKVDTNEQEITKVAFTEHDGYDTIAYSDTLGRIYTAGYNNEGELGNGNTQSTIAPKYMQSNISDYRLIPSENIVNIKKGESKNINVTMFTSGVNLLDKGFTSNYTFKSMDETVASVSGNTITAVGSGTTYVKIADETNKIYGSIKVNVNEIDGQTYPKVSAGNNHFVALKSDGTAYTWGYNVYGQLGDKTNANKKEPKKIYGYIDIAGEKVQTELNNVIDVAGGYSHTLVLTKDGTVWSTGYNGYGQLGDGTTTQRNTFEKVKLNAKGEYLSDIIGITAGANTSYALDKNGNVWSWGVNSNGQFGTGNASNSSYPVKMQNIPNIAQISAGESNLTMLAANRNSMECRIQWIWSIWN